MPEAFIYDHVRTPRGRGKADGALHEVTALNLAAQALGEIKTRGRRRYRAHRGAGRRFR
jgi:acetyl-CoA C-acetyltransferase